MGHSYEISSQYIFNVHSLMFGIMFPTYFLSMWIPNMATTAMMIPIVNAVLAELRKEEIYGVNQRVTSKYFCIV